MTTTPGIAALLALADKIAAFTPSTGPLSLIARGRKLLATGDRELIEDSWRDAFWGWGPNRDGQNALGKLWMEVRDELRALSTTGHPKP